MKDSKIMQNIEGKRSNKKTFSVLDHSNLSQDNILKIQKLSVKKNERLPSPKLSNNLNKIDESQKVMMQISEDEMLNIEN